MNMITEDRTLETLVDRFADACADDYSLAENRSRQITDYVMGRTDQFPELMAKSNHYSYRTLEMLTKLSKKDSGDVFFRAAAVVLRTQLDYNPRHYWYMRPFPVTLGEEAKAFGLGGKSVHGHHRIPAAASRLEQIRKFAGDEPILGEIQYTLRLCKFNSKNVGSVYEIVTMMLLVKSYSLIVPNVLDDIKDTAKMPELLRAVLAGDAGVIKRILPELLEPLIRQTTLSLKDHNSALDLDSDYIQNRREEVITRHFTKQPDVSGEKLTKEQFQETFLAILAAFLFSVNQHGGKARLLSEPDEIGSELLEAVRMLHEVYPLEVREYLLSIDGHTKKRDELLRGIVPVEEPFELIELLRTELNMHQVSWSTLQAAVLSQQAEAVRAFELIQNPYIRAYLRTMLDGQQSLLKEGTPSVEQAVFDVLRDKRYGGRYGLMWARYLEGELTLQAFWGDEQNKKLFQQNNQDPKRKHLLIATSFLPVESSAYRRLAILLTAKEEITTDLLFVLYNANVFDGMAMLKAYDHDPEVNTKQLLNSLFKLNGIHYYYTHVIPEEAYRTLIRNYMQEAIDLYKDLPLESRLTILEVAFKEIEPDSTQLLSEAIRAGLQDTSKKARAAATAKFNEDPERNTELYMHIYRTDKKASIKELVLHAIRSLPNSKELYQQLLTKEKTASLRTMIQVLHDTADQRPEEAHAAIADLTDAKTLGRLGWLSIDDLPNLIGHDGETLDSRIKLYILVQAMDYNSGPNERLNEVRSYANDESLAQFAAELIQLWIQSEAPAKEKWVLYVGALFGDRRLLDLLGPQIKYWTENSRGAIAAETVKMLSYLREPAALMLIDKMMRTIKNRQVRGAAEEALELAAETQGLTPEQLADKLITTLGFNDRGEQTFDYGERSFLVKVKGDLQLIVLNEENGKTLKSLPAPGQKDDPELAAQSKARFTQLKKDLKTMVSLQEQRLEESLSKQRLWTAEEWKELFVSNVIMQKFALGLIWGVYKQGELVDTFRYMEDGTFNTMDEEEFTLESNAIVGLVHPLELAQPVLEGWKTQLEDYEIEQPFPQLDRDTHLITEQDENTKVYESLPEGEYSPTAFPKALEKYGWVKGMAMDAGFYYELYKDYGELIAELRFSGTSISYYEGMEDITLESLSFYINKKSKYHYYDVNQSLTLKDVPSRVFSETLHDILRAAGR